MSQSFVLHFYTFFQIHQFVHMYILQKMLVTSFLALGMSGVAHAQQEKTKFNRVKVNLPGIAARNYQLQYERILSRRFAVAISYRTMPKGAVPFKSTLLELAGDEALADAVTNMEIGGTAITPEVRIYLGKGYGHGFYLAPFYRHARFDANGAKVTFETLPGQTESIALSGTSKANTAGIMLGAQWTLGKHLSLDWWILGPHAGKGRADFKGVPSKTLNAYEQEQLRNKLESMEFPLEAQEINVSANSGQVKLGGTMGGVRAGVSLGVRF